MSEMFRITLPDGSVREVAPGTTPADIAAAIGPGLAKAAIAARVDGELRDIMRPFEGDAQPRAGHGEGRGGRARTRAPRLCACAGRGGAEPVPRHADHLRPVDRRRLLLRFRAHAEHGPFTEEDLPAIEAEMRAIIAADKPLMREVWTPRRADRALDGAGRDLQGRMGRRTARGRGADGLSVRASDWLDMCRGPHLASTGKLDPQAFKLTRVSGAYWRGDQNNAMLSRIYGTGWLNKKQLDAASDAARGSGQARPPQARRRRWTCSTSRPRRMAACSGTPRAIIIWRAARGLYAPPASTRPAIARSRRRS